MKGRIGSGRAGAGLISITHKNKKFLTSVGSKNYEDLYGGLTVSRNFPLIPGFIPTGYEHRPDLITNVFTDSSLGWWRMCEVNNIFDCFEQLNAGDKIYIPGMK